MPAPEPQVKPSSRVFGPLQGKKYKRLRAYKRFIRWWTGMLKREPRLFAHWAWTRELAGLR